MQQMSQYSHANMHQSQYSLMKHDEMLSNTENDGIVLMRLSNVSRELEMENKVEEIGKHRLIQLHAEYNMKLRTLKDKASTLKKKLQILEKYPRCQDLESTLRRKKHIYHTTANAHSIYLNNQKTLKEVNDEHSNLSIIAHCLQNQLQSLVEQYQSQPQQQLSEKCTKKFLNDSHASDATRSTDPMYQQILKENRKLQRQIRFLRHIVKLEGDLEQKIMN
eukprot:48428_1